MSAQAVPAVPVVLHDLLDVAAKNSPSAPALVHGDVVSTYAELSAASRRVAGRLTELGVRRGDRVVVVAPNRVESVWIAYGCSRVGAVFVLLHDQVRGPGLRHVIDDAEPALFVTDDQAARAAVPGHVPTVAVAGIASAEPWSGESPTLAVDPVCLIYTSGSTGMPKAVVSTHGQLLFAVLAIQDRLAYRSDDVVYLPLPLSFDYGLYQVFLAAAVGARVWFGAESGPVLVRDLRRSGATVLPAVPSLAQNLARLLERYGGGLPALRLLTNTGAAMQTGTLQRLRLLLPDLRVQLMFGLTECKRVTIMPPDEDLRRPGSCGVALPGTEVLVLDDDGVPVAPGEVGEIVVRGPNVMSGYWRRPDLTAQRFRREAGLFPRLHSGDYGWLDADGFLYFSGRRDDIYKSRGFRVSATEVEAAACRVAGVDGAVVITPGPRTPTAVLFVATELDPARVLELLRAEIEPHKVPDRCVPVARLPLTPNGKVDRAALIP